MSCSFSARLCISINPLLGGGCMLYSPATSKTHTKQDLENASLKIKCSVGRLEPITDS